MMDIKWITLRVSDMDASVAFYTKVLGMEIASRFHGGMYEITMLGKQEEVKIELLCNRNDEEVGKGVSIGLAVANLSALVTKLQKEGYTLEGYTLEGPITPNPDVSFYFIKDPDGYTIQLLQQH